jgi:hypothetical protein
MQSESWFTSSMSGSGSGNPGYGALRWMRGCIRCSCSSYGLRSTTRSRTTGRLCSGSIVIVRSAGSQHVSLASPLTTMAHMPHRRAPQNHRYATSAPSRSLANSRASRMRMRLEYGTCTVSYRGEVSVLGSHCLIRSVRMSPSRSSSLVPLIVASLSQ